MRKALLLLLPLSIIAVACGDDNGDVTQPADRVTTTVVSGTTPAPETTRAPDTTAAGELASGPVVLENDAGDTVTLDAPAERIVVLEWDFAEHLLALGVTPVGVADAAGYGNWLASELPADVTDVGTRQEPSLESIAALDPDLIIGVDFRHAANLEQFEAIAPTLLFTVYPPPSAGGELEAMRDAVVTLGDAIGDPAAAADVLADLDAHLADAAQRLSDADLAGAEIALAQGFSSEGAPQIRMFTDNARAVELLEQVGLV
ncbi:MAG: ABC transporter substrate-binding protein, partial [Acidimicrobiia bacterium]